MFMCRCMCPVYVMCGCMMYVCYVRFRICVCVRFICRFVLYVLGVWFMCYVLCVRIMLGLCVMCMCYVLCVWEC